MIRDATVSPCGTYRYDLTRRWGAGDFALWVMLNPSTADGSVDDPTINRVIDFTDRYGLRSCMVVNLYAFRSASPVVLESALREGKDAIGPRNDETVRSLAKRAAVIVAAWGAHRTATPRVVPVILALGHRPLLCVGHGKHDVPLHPLYLPSSRPLEPWRPSLEARA